MEIRIGIQNSPREITLESKETSQAVEKSVSEALATHDSVLRLLDASGRVYLIPSNTIAFIELGSETGRRVGFVA